MDAFGYPTMPNFQGEGISSVVGPTNPVGNCETEQPTPTAQVEDGLNNASVGANFAAQGRSDISHILDQIMNITDQVIEFV